MKILFNIYKLNGDINNGVIFVIFVYVQELVDGRFHRGRGR